MRGRRLLAAYGFVCLRVVAPVAGLITASTRADAEMTAQLGLIESLRTNRDAVFFAIFVGLVLFSTTVAIVHMALRRQYQQRESGLTAALDAARARLDRAETFLAAELQITVVWGLDEGEPDIEGDVELIGEASQSRRVLGYASWLAPDQAQALDISVSRLRQRGEPFRQSLVALNGRHLEAEGRAVAGRAVLRLREVSGDRLEATRLREDLFGATTRLEMFKALLDSIPCPAWTRDPLGRLDWVNTAYVRAVEAKDPADAIAHCIELLERQTREASLAQRQRMETCRERATAVLAGWRRSVDVVEVPLGDRATGIVFDVSELEAAINDLRQVASAHARTLDQLSTAVAIFDRGKQLVFHNAAYRQLWNLDPAFLDRKPTDPEVLDRLRARRLLPEQADFPAWRDAILQSTETSDQTWYLPDGRILRAVINPNPQAGVTYLFDDLTALRDLEARFIAQTRVQRETLDTLKEGVAFFGTDGRLRLSNAAFKSLWKLTPSDLEGTPHVDKVAALCTRLSPDPAPWNTLRTLVTGFHDQRTGTELRLACRDGSTLDCTAAPLPDGATLLTFTDMTASVNEERLRNDFVHHVSYELRSPLTNIIGFIQLLGDGSIGSLNPKQSEYVGYVMKSSAALLAIINDILDLATIDTGALELNVKRVDVLETIRSAEEGVQDRLAENALTLQVVALPNIGTFLADPKRVRQILYNLLSNAIGFSSPGQTVTLAAMRRGDEIVFKIADQGRGIPHDLIPHVFERFHSNTMNSRHRGVGLGLSIVKSFVELHGGRVLVDSVAGQGTTVTCIFPTHDEKVNAQEA